MSETLVESVKRNRRDYNAAIDSVIEQINGTRAQTNVAFDITIDQLTKVANDFPASLVTIPAPGIAPLPDPVAS